MKKHNVIWIMLVLAAIAVVGCKSGKREQVIKASARPADTEAARALNRDAAEMLEARQFDKAEPLLRRALERDVMFGPAHNNLGLVHFHQGKMYQAAWEFEYAIKLMPHHPEPRNNLGLVFEQVGRVDEAVEQYGKARELQPDNPQFLGNLARARIRRGDTDAQTRELLDEMAMKETRPEWLAWAQERLVRMPPPKDDIHFITPTTREAPPTTAPTTGGPS